MYIDFDFNNNINGNVYNNGTLTGQAIITATFTAAATEYKIIDAATSKYIRIIKALVNTDVIVIDLEKQYVTLNGVNAMLYLDLNSRFFKIPIANSYYTITPVNVQNTKITLTPKYL
jgi:phage-related protein